ncbi:MAG: hypothetical protein AAGK01_02560, partial [Pseudomonadota bacterium]
MASENREQFRGHTTNAGLNQLYQQDQGNNDHVRIGMGTIDAVRNQIRSYVQAERAADPAAHPLPEGRLNGFEVPRGVDNNPTSTYFIRKHHYGEHLAFKGIDPPATMPGRREFQSLYNAQQTEREREAAEAPAQGVAPATVPQPQDRDDRGRNNPPDQARDDRSDDDSGDSDDDRGTGGGLVAARKREREAQAPGAEDDQQQGDTTNKRQRTQATGIDDESATLDDSQSSFSTIDRMLDNTDSRENESQSSRNILRNLGFINSQESTDSDQQALAPPFAATPPATGQGVAHAQQPEPSALNNNSTREEVEDWLAARRLDNPHNIPNFRNNERLSDFIRRENSDITNPRSIQLSGDAAQRMNAGTIARQAVTQGAIDNDDDRKPAAVQRNPANNQQQPGLGDDGAPVAGGSLESLAQATLSVDGNSQSNSQGSSATINDLINASAIDALDKSRRDSIGSVGSLLDFPEDESRSATETAQQTDSTGTNEASNEATQTPRGRTNYMEDMEVGDLRGQESPIFSSNDPFSQLSKIVDPGTPGSLDQSIRSWDETPSSASPPQRAADSNTVERETAPFMPQDWDNHAPINLQQRTSQRDLDTLTEASELMRDGSIDHSKEQDRETSTASETLDAEQSKKRNAGEISATDPTGALEAQEQEGTEQAEKRARVEANEASDASATTEKTGNLGDTGRASSSEPLSPTAEEGQREDQREPVVQDEPDRGPHVQRDPDDDNDAAGSTAVAPASQVAQQEAESRGDEAQTSTTQDQQSAQDAAEAENKAAAGVDEQTVQSRESTVDVDLPDGTGEKNKRPAEEISTEASADGEDQQESGERDAKKARVEQSVAAENDEPAETANLNIGERRRQTESGEYAAIASNAEAEVRAAAEAGTTPPGRQT